MNTIDKIYKPILYFPPFSLNSALSDSSSNFHPQGLGYDPIANELLYMQQSANAIFRTDLNGTLLGSRTIGTINTNGSGTSSTANHAVSVASDGIFYYFSDYTCNTGCFDLHRIGISGGTSTNISNETAAFGGYRSN